MPLDCSLMKPATPEASAHSTGQHENAPAKTGFSGTGAGPNSNVRMLAASASLFAAPPDLTGWPLAAEVGSRIFPAGVLSEAAGAIASCGQFYTEETWPTNAASTKAGIGMNPSSRCCNRFSSTMLGRRPKHPASQFLYAVLRWLRCRALTRAVTASLASLAPLGGQAQAVIGLLFQHALQVLSSALRLQTPFGRAALSQPDLRPLASASRGAGDPEFERCSRAVPLSSRSLVLRCDLCTHDQREIVRAQVASLCRHRLASQHKSLCKFACSLNLCS